MAREAAQLVSLLSQPTPLRHDVGAQHDLIDILEAESGVHERGLARRERHVGAQSEDTIMLMRSVPTGERAQSLRLIAQAKTQAAAVELIKRHILRWIEHDVAQRLGK